MISLTAQVNPENADIKENIIFRFIYFDPAGLRMNLPQIPTKGGLMKVIEFLKKIGILRYGAAAGTYKNAKDAPDMLLTENYSTPGSETPVPTPDETPPSD